jgi:hypothetical protein
LAIFFSLLPSNYQSKSRWPPSPLVPRFSPAFSFKGDLNWGGRRDAAGVRRRTTAAAGALRAVPLRHQRRRRRRRHRRHPSARSASCSSSHLLRVILGNLLCLSCLGFRLGNDSKEIGMYDSGANSGFRFSSFSQKF